MKHRLLLYIFVMSLLTSACSNDYGIEEIDSALVVEGWIEEGDFPVVILTKSLPISNEYHDLDSLENFLVRWAKVTISDGTTSVVLTGKYDSGYYPPYIYTTGWMKGQAGKSYYLTVEYDDYYATSVTTIPHHTVKDTILVEKVEQSDTLYQIKSKFSDPSEEKNFYMYFTRVGTESKQFIASYLGCINDDAIQGEVEIPVYRGHRLGGPQYTPYFSINDTVSIKFAQIDETAYSFWDDYTKAQSLSGNMFLASPSKIRTNIEGAIGCWYGFAASTTHLIMKEQIAK